MQAMPAIVSQRLPDIAHQLTILCQKMKDERMKILTDNEEHLQKEEARRLKGENGSDDEGDGFVDEENDEDGSDDENDEQAVLKKLERFRQRGKNAEVDEPEEDDDEDDDDSDYEYTGGDLAIYDSALDDVDELTYVRDQLERISSAHSDFAQHLFSTTPAEDFSKFQETMRTAQELKDREEVIRLRCEEIDNPVKAA